MTAVPAATVDPIAPPEPDIDWVVVYRAMQGIRVKANRAERLETLRQWLAAGRVMAQLDRQQGWNLHRDLKDTTGSGRIAA